MSGKPDYTDPEILSELYHDEQLTLSQIADRLECHRNTVRRWMDRNDIERRDTRKNKGQERYDIPEDELRKLYVTKGMSMRECAEYYGCSNVTVRNRLDHYGIDIRGRDYSYANSLHPSVFVNGNGYRYAQCNQCNEKVGIHQLVAVADGADPEKVFSGGEWVTHHVSQHKLDNRPGNLLVTEPGMHENIHNADWLLREGTDDELGAFVELAEMRGTAGRLREALAE